MSEYIKVKTTDHQTVFLKKTNIAGIEPVPSGTRASEHIRVFAGGYKWLIEETHESFMEKVGIPFEKDEAVEGE